MSPQLWVYAVVQTAIGPGCWCWRRARPHVRQWLAARAPSAIRRPAAVNRRATLADWLAAILFLLGVAALTVWWVT